MRAPLDSASDTSVSAGSSHACSAEESNVPQWTGMSVPPPSRRKASRALAGPRWMSPHAGCHAPISSITQIERCEPFADGGELVGKTGIAREKDAPVGGDHPRRPEGGIAISQRSTGEMLRGRRGESELTSGQRALLPPIELGDECRVEAEPFEVRADAERRYDRDAQLGQRSHAGRAEVIVVIVRQEHRVEWRKLLDRHRDGVEAAGARERDRRGALSENWIGKNA